LAAQWTDLIFPLLVLIGVEHAGIRDGSNPFLRLDLQSYPISHSLAAGAAWAALLGGIVYWRARDRTAALVVAAAVTSHWVLDFVSHTPDMPLWPGGPLVGLGLWRTLAGTVVVEVLLFAAGLWLYFGATVPRDRVGRWAVPAFAAFLGLLYLGNITSPAPPDVQAFALVGLAGWLFPLWAWWGDRHREAARSD
jgi:membrane-bound metal-dependent hydrolase YbcI (DUF457 family)